MEHYRILAEVLNEIRKQDETSWIWNKAKLELIYLSRLVDRNLAEFNVEGKGTGLVLDGYPGAYNCFLGCTLCGAMIGAIVACALGPQVLACIATALGVRVSAVLVVIQTFGSLGWGCVTCCCCLGYQPCCSLLGY